METFLLFRCWPMWNIFMENGTSMKFGQFSPAYISCKMLQLKSLWLTEVSMVKRKTGKCYIKVSCGQIKTTGCLQCTV